MELLSITEPFAEVAVLLLVAAVAGAIAMVLRQPLIVAFLAVGVLTAPLGLAFNEIGDTIHLLGELGITMLLFLVGLRLDPRALRHMGPAALAVGTGQILVTFAVATAISLLLGFLWFPSLYIAFALTLSSTIIVIKLLADKHELDSLHGRIAVGVLLVQDLFVVLAFAFLPLLNGEGGSTGLQVVLLLLQGIALVGAAWLIVWLARRWLLDRLARSKEFLGIAAVAWAVALGAIAEGIGLSKELGAFVAGVTLATTAYRDAIGSRLVSLRDFLLLFFLIDLGSVMDFGSLGDQVVTAIILSAFVLIGKPIIIMAIMGALGYHRKTSFRTATSMAQISSFSLVLVALGLRLGHIDPSHVGLITMVGLVTMAVSTYLIMNVERAYTLASPLLGIFERRHPRKGLKEDEHDASYDVLLFGLGRYGQAIANSITARNLRVLVIDIDPRIVHQARAQGLAARFGDAGDQQYPEHLPLATAQWVVGTMADVETGRALADALRDHGYTGRLALTAHTAAEARLLEDASPDLVLLPFKEAATHAVAAMLDD